MSNRTHRADDGRADFDFLHGSWRIRNRKLSALLEGSEDWLEFDSTAEVRPILHGLGNFEQISIPDMPGAGAFEGATLRLFDPELDRWQIFWSSTSRPGHLDPPLAGSFDGSAGVFHGEDTLDGQPIEVRFRWEPGREQASWQQSFSADAGRTWELNWVMEFERVRS